MWNVVPFKQHLAICCYKSEVGLYIHKPESNVDQAYVLKVHLHIFLVCWLQQFYVC